MLIKICGITRLDDARRAVDAGADALGFVFWPRSPRYVMPDEAAAIVGTLPPGVTTVGVFVNESVDGIRAAVNASGVAVVQLHGDEAASYAADLQLPVFRSLSLDDAEAVTAAWPEDTVFLLDAADRVRRGGTGILIDHVRAAAVARRRRVILAGGLTPENVGEAIASVRPYGVDVSSGVEQAPGLKEPGKVARFVTSARHAFERIDA